MRKPTRLGLVAVLGAAALFVACSDDETPDPGNPAGGFAGSKSGSGAGGSAGSSLAGSSSGTFGAGTGGVGGSSAGVGGAGGPAAGAGGTTAGTAGTGGTGGTPPAIVPTVLLFDNVRLQPKVEGSGGGGAGAGGDSGEIGGGAGGAGPEAAGGGGGEVAVGGAGAGGAPSQPPDFLETFDAGLGLLSIKADGFSPGPGGSEGPPIHPQTTLLFDAAAGMPGGAAKASVPFSVPKQQADFGGNFASPQDLTGYELLADVKLSGVGDVGQCVSAWMYVYGGGGYANDQTAEPLNGKTLHLKKDEWMTVRLDLDGPYGYHSVANHPNFTPTGMVVWGIHVNTWGCP